MENEETGIVGVLAQTLRTHRSDVTCVDFYQDHKLATASSDKSVRVWGWRAGLGFVEAERSPLLGHKFGVCAVQFSPQGTLLGSCSIDGSTCVWPATGDRATHGATRPATRLLQPGGASVRTLRFSRDSRFVLTGADDGTLCAWDLRRKHLLRRVAGHEGAVGALCVCGGLVLSACTLGVLNLYSLSELTEDEGTEVTARGTRHDAHDLGVLTAAAAPGACEWRVATGGHDACARLWSASPDGTIQLLHTLEGHTSAVTCVAWSGCGEVVGSASMDKSVRVWCARAGICTGVLTAHARYINTLVFSQRHLLLATGSNDKSVRVWCLCAGEKNSVSVSLSSELQPDCSLLAHFATGDLKGISAVCEAERDEEEVRVRGEGERLCSDTHTHAGAINSLVFTGPRSLATACSDGNVRVWEFGDAGSLDCVLEIAAHRYPATAVDVSLAPPRLLSSSLDTTVAVHHLQTGARICTMSAECAEASGSGGGGGARDVRAEPAHPGNAREVEGGPHLLIASDDYVALLYSLEDPTQPLYVYTGHSDCVSCCAWSPDARLILTGSHAGDFRLHRAPSHVAPLGHTGQIHVQTHAHDLGVQSCDWASGADAASESAGAMLVATGGNDSLAKLWLLEPTQTDEEGVTEVRVSVWRALAGHGGNVLCVRFSPAGDLLASSATDKLVRVWCVRTGRCVFAGAGSAGVAACALTSTRVLAVGCLDGELALWQLAPPPLPSLHSEVIDGSGCGESGTGGGCVWGEVRGWSSVELIVWLQQHVTHTPDCTDWECTLRGMDGASVARGAGPAVACACGALQTELDWLRTRARVEKGPAPPRAPHHLLCPLTHRVMLDPVACADGFTYERVAVAESFLASPEEEAMSPLTGARLLNARLSVNREIYTQVKTFLAHHSLHIQSNEKETIDIVDNAL